MPFLYESPELVFHGLAPADFAAYASPRLRYIHALYSLRSGAGFIIPTVAREALASAEFNLIGKVMPA